MKFYIVLFIFMIFSFYLYNNIEHYDRYKYRNTHPVINLNNIDLNNRRDSRNNNITVNPNIYNESSINKESNGSYKNT